MTWQLMIIIAILTGALATISNKVALSGKQRIGVYENSFVLSLVTFLVLLLVAITTSHFIVPPISAFPWLFIANITLGLVGWLTAQKALSLMASGEYTVIMTTRIVITWLVSIAFLGIGVHQLQAAGVILLAIAVSTLFYKRKEFAKSNLSGIVFTLATAVNYGVGMVIDQVIYKQSDPLSYMIIGFGLNTGLLLLLRPSVIRSLRYYKTPKVVMAISLSGILSAVSMVLLFTSLKLSNNAIVITALLQVQVIVIAITAGIFIQKERKGTYRTLIAAIFACLGAWLLLK